MKSSNNISNIKCSICGKWIYQNSWFRHIDKKHSALSDMDKCILFNEGCGEYIKIPFKYVKLIINWWFRHGIVSSFKDYKNKIGHLIKIKKYIRAIELYEPFCEQHIQYYHSTFISFRKQYPQTNTSHEYCYALFGGNKIKGDDYYQKIVLPKNPYYQHGSELSPFSKSFVGYC